MSPEYLENISKEVIDLYSNMETELIENVARKIGGNKALFERVDDVTITDWELDRLRQLDALNEENARIIAKHSQRTPEEVQKIFQQATETNLQRTEANIRAGVEAGSLRPVPPLNESQRVQHALNVGTQKTMTSFNQANNLMLRSAGETYRRSVSNISTQVIAGTTTKEQALTRSLKELARTGVTSFEASNGAKWSPEAYTRMVIRSDVKNTVTRVTQERIRECGGEYIEVSSHEGARELCEEDQGQIYSLDDDTTPITDLTGDVIYPRAFSDTSYGEPDGLFGINCNHTQWMFVPGISMYDPKEIDPEVNQQVYKEGQEQRKLERSVREAKRERSALELGGASGEDIQRAQNKITNRQGQLREFTKDTGRTRDYSREQI